MIIIVQNFLFLAVSSICISMWAYLNLMFIEWKNKYTSLTRLLFNKGEVEFLWSSTEYFWIISGDSHLPNTGRNFVPNAQLEVDIR